MSNSSSTITTDHSAVADAQTTSKGYSLHIGLNKADPEHYSSLPLLKAAVADAKFWERYAREQGYWATHLHDENATAEEVKEQIMHIANLLQPGDIFLLTYAGHGGLVANDKPRGFDDERYDQTWCLYNRQLLDDELYECFEAFKEGTRILVVSDSCHSGTVTRADDLNFSQMLAQGISRAARSRDYRSRKLPKEVEQLVMASWGGEIYEPIQEKYRIKHKGSGVKAAVKLLAACQDDEETLDGAVNGIFTEAFIRVFKEGKHTQGNAQALIEEVSKHYYFPRPNFFEYGSIIQSFDRSFPFTINIPEAGTVSGYRNPDLKPKKSAKPVVPSTEPWDTRDQTENAVLLIEVNGGIDGKWTTGKDIKLKDKKQRGTLEMITIEVEQVPLEYAWSAAHALQTEFDNVRINALVEPVLTITPAQQARISREGDITNPDYIKEWPPSLNQDKVGLGWHLDDEHSQLSKAHKYLVG